MKHSLILKQGMLSEKIYLQMENSVYTFIVSKETSKSEIKKAVETQFKVKVKKVNVLSKAAKKRRVTGTRKVVETGAAKKAVVFLAAGENISMLSPKSESKKKSSPKGTEKTEKKGLISRIKKEKKEEGK